MKRKIFIVLALLLVIIIATSEEKTITPLKPIALSDNEVITPTFKSGDFFDSAIWNDPSVIYDNNQFVMYASAGKGFSGDIDIYRLISQDGITWELNPSTAILENSTDDTAIDTKAVETPSVVVFNGTYHMFYTGYAGHFSDSKKYRVLHATSADGITWTKDPNFIIAPTKPDGLLPTMEFNQWVTAEPGAVVFKDQLYLYFAAIGANETTQSPLSTIGLITSKDGTTWSNPRQVLVPDQSIYPADTYYGYSTPAAAVKDGELELYFDIVNLDPWKQIAVSKAVSSNGITDWKLDATPLISTTNVSWASNEVLAPSTIYKNGKRYLWFSGLEGNTVTIGLLH